MQSNNQDMSTTKGNKEIELSQAIELKLNQKPGDPNKTKRGTKRTRTRRIARAS